MLVALYLFIYVSYFRGKQRGTGLKVTVSVQDKRGSRLQYSGETNRLFEYKKWHNITVRFQDAQSLIRIFVDDKMIVVKEFRGFDIFPDDAQLRLAQVYAVDAEDLGAIKDRFTVSHCQEKKMYRKGRFLTPFREAPKSVTIAPLISTPITMLSLELLLASGV